VLLTLLLLLLLLRLHCRCCCYVVRYGVVVVVTLLLLRCYALRLRCCVVRCCWLVVGCLRTLPVGYFDLVILPVAFIVVTFVTRCVTPRLHTFVTPCICCVGCYVVARLLLRRVTTYGLRWFTFGWLRCPIRVRCWFTLVGWLAVGCGYCYCPRFDCTLPVDVGFVGWLYPHCPVALVVVYCCCGFYVVVVVGLRLLIYVYVALCRLLLPFTLLCCRCPGSLPLFYLLLHTRFVVCPICVVAPHPLRTIVGCSLRLLYVVGCVGYPVGTFVTRFVTVVCTFITPLFTGCCVVDVVTVVVRPDCPLFSLVTRLLPGC